MDVNNFQAACSYPEEGSARESLHQALDRAKVTYPEYYVQMAYALIDACIDNNLDGVESGVQNPNCPACVLGTMCRLPVRNRIGARSVKAIEARMTVFLNLRPDNRLQPIERYVLNVKPHARSLLNLRVLANVALWTESWLRKHSTAAERRDKSC